jgi:hypothetical protein
MTEREFWRRLGTTPGDGWYVAPCGFIRRESPSGCDCPITAVYRTLHPYHKRRPSSYASVACSMRLDPSFANLVAEESDCDGSACGPRRRRIRLRILRKVGLLGT